MVQNRIRETPTDTALRARRERVWVDVTWGELGARIERVAAGMLTAMDVPERAAVTIVADTCEDWVVCDFALLSVGLRTIPVYATLLPEECGFIHTDSDAVMAIVENAEQLEKVRSFRDGFEFFDRLYDPDEISLSHIVVIDPSGIQPADDWESLEELEARGARELESTAADRERRGEAVSRDDVCTYTYTSGTTGLPKGVIQTNGNLLSALEILESEDTFDDTIRENGVFMFLPLAHSFGRLLELGSVYFNSPMILSSIPTIADDLKATRPGCFPAAPRVYEKIMSKIEAGVEGASPTKQKLFRWAVDAGKATIPYRIEGKPLPFAIGLKYRLADRLVLSKIRAALGLDRCELLVSGSAPLYSDVHEFFLACGLTLVEGYGLTETCPILTSNQPGRIRVGTVGQAYDAIDIKIADDGEILARGPNITPGYLNRPDATDAAFEDGWFKTGDLGSLDGDGFLRITGRKKELMKTSGGKYIAPAKIEGRLKTLPKIQEAIVVADYRNYATALIAIDPEELEVWSEQIGEAPDPHSQAVRERVQAHVDEVNQSLASFETIKYFRIIDALTVEDGLLTASLKVRRGPVYERYETLIDEMYV